MFAWYAGIGMAHDTVLLEQHPHGLGVDNPQADNNENDDKGEEPSPRKEPPEDKREDDNMDENKDDAEDGSDSDSDDSGANVSDDNTSYTCL